MKLRKTAAALGAGAAVLLAVTACGSDGDTDTTPAPTTAAEAPTGTDGQSTDAAGTPPVPSVDELNAQLQKALDPNVPVEEKQELVTGLEADPQLIQTLSDKVEEAKADGSLGEIAVVGPILPPQGDVLSVPFTATFGDQTNTGEATLLAVDGQWRLDGQFVCGLAGVVGVESPACTA